MSADEVYTESEGIDFFPYDELRENQGVGMNIVHDVLSSEGFAIIEGACGTGKSLMALCPALHLARTQGNEVDSIVVATSVKQQQEAFQSEVERINRELSGREKISAVTVVGLTDMHPFVRNEVVNSAGEVQRLRGNTRQLVSDERYDLDPATLVTNAKQSDSEPGYYGGTVPSYQNLEYDPYYARYLDMKREVTENKPTYTLLPFKPDSEGMLRPSDIRNHAESVGLCPHKAMQESIGAVDIVIANYYHVFDPKSAQVTAPVLTEESIVVLDETHNLVDDVREVLSSELAFSTIESAVREAGEIENLFDVNVDRLRKVRDVNIDKDQQRLTVDEKAVEHARTVRDWIENGRVIGGSPDEVIEASEALDSLVESTNLNKESLNDWREFVVEAKEAIERYVEKENVPLDEETKTIELRDPESNEPDKLSQWASLQDNNTFSSVEEIGTILSDIRLHILSETLGDGSATTDIAPVSRFFGQWERENNVDYFRYISMEPSQEEDGSWKNYYNTKLEMFNCTPCEEVAERLSVFSGGILMSATLQPFEVFKEEVGLDILKDNGRQIVSRSFGLPFEEQNRESLSVDVTKFKRSERGATFSRGKPNTENSTRKMYRELLLDTVDSVPGNVLISMPSYTEAKWAGEVLKRSFTVDRSDVLVDESSSNTKTQSLKESFFNKSEGVLVTGARGTLVEGVDYYGDRLSAVVVCGVPIQNTYTPKAKAIKTAYTKAFGTENGFEYAFTVPAVRKARQSIGRVIRSNNDVGVRVLADSRYTHAEQWDAVRQYLSEQEQREFDDVSKKDVPDRITELFSS